MINRRIKGADLIGKRCRPVHSIKNGAGNVVTKDTVCIIKAVTPGSGFAIITEKCPCCGQQSYITRIKREELELVEDDANNAPHPAEGGLNE